MTSSKEKLIGFSEKIAFEILPYKRNQDVIEIGKYSISQGEEIFFASIVDGWNNPEKMPNDTSGRIVAERVSKQYPNLFFQELQARSFNLKEVAEIANKAALKMDKEVLSWYPAHASCACAFVFEIRDQTIVIAQGTISALFWNGKIWEKPPEIGDYILDPNKYESGSKTFFGRGELKGGSFYTAHVDTVIAPPSTPILIATDGLIMEKKMMSLEELNNFSQEASILDSQAFISELSKYIESRRNLQKDDISIFIKSAQKK